MMTIKGRALYGFILRCAKSVHDPVVDPFRVVENSIGLMYTIYGGYLRSGIAARIFQKILNSNEWIEMSIFLSAILSFAGLRRMC